MFSLQSECENDINKDLQCLEKKNLNYSIFRTLDIYHNILKSLKIISIHMSLQVFKFSNAHEIK